jgi:imidazole glycerol phosphate synthase glutamine amidotransferase subunit
MISPIVVDSGSGNLRSLCNGLRQSGLEAVVLREPPVQAPEVLFLPGVGAFGHAARALQERGWYEAIPAFLRAGSRLVGICLGMQLLFETSEESPNARGLGLIPGAVRLLNPVAAKVPHMGWARLRFVRPAAVPLPWAYFVHSYAAHPEEVSCVEAWASHGTAEFPSVVRSGRVVGVQFHPEKSQGPGVAFLAALAGGGP